MVYVNLVQPGATIEFTWWLKYLFIISNLFCLKC